ncbi:MAG: HdeD family acid-resistance protein [Armatimonadota bacterium]
MREQLARNWWVVALRGVLAILFALLAFAWPGITLLTLVWLWGAYALADGIFTILAAIRSAERQRPWGMLLLAGIVGILAGIIAFVWPGITALALIYLIAAWAIVTGILGIAAAVRLREEIEGEWVLALGGVLSIGLGILIALMPRAGLLAWVWLLAAYALIFGIGMLVLAFRLRALRPEEPRRRAAA